MWGEFEDHGESKNDSCASEVKPQQNSDLSCSNKGESGEDESYALPLRDRIIHHIASSSLTLKSQQRYEPDLTFEERKTLAGELLDKPGHFLYRFGKHLLREHFQYFLKFEGNPEVDHYLMEAMKSQNKHTAKITVRNRRYAAIQELRHSGTYFSEKEMERRDPLLYDQLIGCHLTEEEKAMSQDNGVTNESEIRFSSLLLDHIDSYSERSLKKKQEEEEDNMIEEEDSDSDEEEDGDETMSENLESGQKQLFREEFYTSLYHNFLRGKDTDFDYGKVDSCDKYDLLDIRARDEEERYFDEDDDDDNVDNVSQENEPDDNSTMCCD